MGKQIRKRLEKIAQKDFHWDEYLKTKKTVKTSKRETYGLKLPEEIFSRVFVRNWADFKTRSHNQRTRNLEALKYLFCKYRIFSWIPEMYLDLVETESANGSNIVLDLLVALGSGRSAKDILKAYLSKKEIATFAKLTPDKHFGIWDFLIYCKAKARDIPHDVASHIVFLIKKGEYSEYLIDGYKDKLESLLDFVERTKMSKLAFEDFFDFYVRRCQMEFNFHGRTLRSVFNLVNEWHEELNRLKPITRAGQARFNRLEAEMLDRLLAVKVYKYSAITKWEYTSNGKDIVECSQIRTQNDLINEGRAMHNCVASYHFSCASGNCEIFSMTCNEARIATLEVVNKQVVQARGPCNGLLKGDALKYYKRWCKERSLVDMCYSC